MYSTLFVAEKALKTKLGSMVGGIALASLEALCYYRRNMRRQELGSYDHGRHGEVSAAD